MAMLALALTGIAQPAAAQDARACVNEVQRLSEAFPLVGGHGDQAGAAIAQAPGARKGAGLGEEQRRQIGDLVEEARAAGERGDGAGCLQRLAEARALLRQAGLGSRQPGSPSSAGSGVGGALGSGIPGAAGSLGPPTTTRPGGMGGSTLGGTDGGAAGGGASGGGGSSGGGGG
jgi:hypothetical protein